MLSLESGEYFFTIYHYHRAITNATIADNKIVIDDDIIPDNALLHGLYVEGPVVYRPKRTRQ
jgi:hypothetical protein